MTPAKRKDGLQNGAPAFLDARACLFGRSGAAGPAAERLLHKRLARQEQVRRLSAGAGDEAVHDAVMTFNGSVAQDVPDFRAARDEARRDKKRAVAVEGFGFRAHQRDVHFRPARERALDPAFEESGSGEALIAHLAVHMTLRVFRPRAELFAEKDILNPGARKRIAQRLAIELRIDAAVRRRAHVRHRLDAGNGEQREEAVNRMG